jgi:hypothetical protein
LNNARGYSWLFEPMDLIALQHRPGCSVTSRIMIRDVTILEECQPTFECGIMHGHDNVIEPGGAGTLNCEIAPTAMAAVHPTGHPKNSYLDTIPPTS